MPQVHHPVRRGWRCSRRGAGAAGEGGSHDHTAQGVTFSTHPCATVSRPSRRRGALRPPATSVFSFGTFLIMPGTLVESSGPGWDHLIAEVVAPPAHYYYRCFSQFLRCGQPLESYTTYQMPQLKATAVAAGYRCTISVLVPCAGVCQAAALPSA